MSDNNEQMDSIIEFSEDIASQEAPEPLPAGRDYAASIIEAQAKTSTNSGKRYLSLKVLIRPEEYPADYDAANAPEGTTLSYNLVSLEDTAQSRYRLRMFCEAIGVAASKRLDINEFVHRECRVTLKHEFFDGIKRAAIEKLTQ